MVREEGASVGCWCCDGCRSRLGFARRSRQGGVAGGAVAPARLLRNADTARISSALAAVQVLTPILDPSNPRRRCLPPALFPAVLSSLRRSAPLHLLPSSPSSCHSHFPVPDSSLPTPHSKDAFTVSTKASSLLQRNCPRHIRRRHTHSMHQTVTHRRQKFPVLVLHRPSCRQTSSCTLHPSQTQPGPFPDVICRAANSQPWTQVCKSSPRLDLSRATNNIRPCPLFHGPRHECI